MLVIVDRINIWLAAVDTLIRYGSLELLPLHNGDKGGIKYSRKLPLANLFLLSTVV